MAVPAPKDPEAISFVQERIQSLVGEAYQIDGKGMVDQYRFVAALLGSSAELFDMCVTELAAFATFDPADGRDGAQDVLQTESWKLIVKVIKRFDELDHKKVKKKPFRDMVCIVGAKEEPDKVTALISKFQELQVSPASPSPCPTPISPCPSPSLGPSFFSARCPSPLHRFTLLRQPRRSAKNPAQASARRQPTPSPAPVCRRRPPRLRTGRPASGLATRACVRLALLRCSAAF